MLFENETSHLVYVGILGLYFYHGFLSVYPSIFHFLACVNQFQPNVEEEISVMLTLEKPPGSG